MIAQRLRPVLAFLALATLAFGTPRAQTLGADFSGYSVSDLGAVPGLPNPYGGLTFLDNDTILIGGEANEPTGLLYTIDVTRDASNHINGYTGTASVFRGPASTIGAFNDGGVVFGPSGVLFTSRWPENELGQTRPGSTAEDKIIDMAALGVADSHAAINFVPAGFGGAGQVKLVSWADGQWYSASLSPDGAGTFDLINVVQVDLDPGPDVGVLPGGPEGFVYVSAGNPGFAVNSLLISEFSSDSVAVYDVDANSDPMLASRRVFLDGLLGAEGAVLDPLTGDFLFSTFANVDAQGDPIDDHVVVVSGFTKLPPPPVPEPQTYALMLAGLAGVSVIARRKIRRPV